MTEPNTPPTEPSAPTTSAGGERPAGRRSRDAMMMRTPPWLIRVSNAAAGIAIVGGLFLAIQMTHRLLTRKVVAPRPSLAQLADSARMGAAAATAAERTTAGASRGLPLPDDGTPATIGGAAPLDSVLRTAQRALWRGRWGDAARDFSRVTGDSSRGSAALALSLLAAWSYDEGASREALERAVQHEAQLSSPERTLLDAHQRWMTGDIRGSDSVYRALLTEVKDDPTLWYAAAFVHRHDGGMIDSALIAPGSLVSRKLRNQPARRLSHVGAIPALWQVLALSPYHEAARVELARFASVYDDRALASRLAWGAELYDVEPATRFVMRVLGADSKRDTTAWKIVLQLADQQRDPGTLFAASRALATSGGALRPLSLWHAAELLEPLTRAAQVPRDVAAIAHAWRAELYFAVNRQSASTDELEAAAAIDASLALPLLAWTHWLSRDLPDSTLGALRTRLDDWEVSASDSGAARSWLHPHRGMESHLRLYGIGLLSAALGDTVRVQSAASALDALPPIAGDTALRAEMAGALRAEVAIARGDYDAAIAATNNLQQPLPPLWRELSPFSGRVHARYRRAFAEQRAWRNVQARAAFVSFFSPTVPELPVYRSARQRFDATP